MPGYIKLWRQIRKNKLWDQKPFDDARAWIDLLLRANWKRGKLPQPGGESVLVDLGEVVVSKHGLAEQWGWSRNKVKRFLKLLEGGPTCGPTCGPTIEVTSGPTHTRVKIVNWNKFQGGGISADPPWPDEVDPDADPDADPIKEVKKSKNNSNRVRPKPTTLLKWLYGHRWAFDRKVYCDLAHRLQNRTGIEYVACLALISEAIPKDDPVTYLNKIIETKAEPSDDAWLRAKQLLHKHDRNRVGVKSMGRALELHRKRVSEIRRDEKRRRKTR